jgi:hypothetical protein
MNKLQKSSVILVLLIFSCFIFYKKTELSSIQFVTTEPLKNNVVDETGVEKPVQTAAVNVVTSAEDKKYVRVAHKKKISARDASKVLDNTYNKDLFTKMAAGYKNRELAQQDTVAVWDLNKKPETHPEMQLYLEELRYALLTDLEEAIISNDRQKAIKYAGLHLGYTFLAVFDFKGYDKDGAAKIELPADLQKSYAKVLKTSPDQKSKKAVAKNSKKNIKGTNQKRKVAQENTDEIIEALNEQKLSQMSYFEDLKNAGNMDESYAQNESKFSALTELMEGFITKMEGFDSFNFFKSAEELHEGNQDIIRTTIENIRKRPQRYGLDPEAIKDMTDVEFPVYADSALRTESLKYAMIGAALSVGVNLISGGQGNFLKTNPIFKGVSLLGEGLVTALGCYQGAKSMILLQRYYSFMKDKKEAFRRDGKDFFPKQNSELFDASKVYHSVGMKREINKAWAWGLTWGLANKFNLGSKAYSSVVSLSGYAVSFAVDGLFRMYASSTIGVRLIGEYGIRAGLGIATVRGFIQHVIGKGAMLSKSFLGWLFKYLIRGLKKIPHATAVVASLGEATVTGTFVYAAVYSRLTSTKFMLDRVHFSPEVAIYLSLDAVSAETEENFLEASRKNFYPVCYFFATKVANFEKETVLSDVQGDVKASRDKKIEGCLTSIATFEGVELKDVEEQLKKISNPVSPVNSLHATYFNDVPVSIITVKNLLKSIQMDYPAHYRMVWITAFKAIYPIDQVPDEFYIYKDLLILGNPNLVNGFFEEYISLSTHKSAEHINTDRFTYTIERLVSKTNEFKKNKKTEDGEAFTDADKVTASEAFGLYWNYFKENKGETDKILQDLLNTEELSWWGMLKKGIDDAARGIKWLWDDFRLLVGHKTYSYKADSDIETILKDF